MNILVIGGDRRQIFLTENLKQKGYTAEHIATGKNLKEKIGKCDVVILPTPSSKDNITVYNTLSDDKIYISDLKEYIKAQKILTCKLYFEGKNCIDYCELESFAIKNAVPTAEAAIAIAINNSERTLFGSKCLVIGNGRIGKILSVMLKNLGADTTVSARKSADLSFIETLNMKSIETANIAKTAHKFDFIFNTVNSPVITDDFLVSCKNRAILIELASLPGGINGNTETAKCKIINAQGLPGKYSPISAAEILTETVIDIISKGENL